jgi:hypothetical protein
MINPKNSFFFHWCRNLILDLASLSHELFYRVCVYSPSVKINLLKFLGIICLSRRVIDIKKCFVISTGKCVTCLISLLLNSEDSLLKFIFHLIALDEVLTV